MSELDPATNPYAYALADDPDNPHLYIAGKTQSGKSNLLFFRIMADILRGRGLCVIDAKSGLVRDLKQWIPASLCHKVIYLGPENHIPLDWMSYGGTTPEERENEKAAVIAEIKYLFLKTANTTGMPIIKDNTNWIINALYEYNENPATLPNKRATFMDIYYFLTNKIRRDEIVAGIKSQQLKNHWLNPDNLPTGENLRHLTIRMSDFVTSPSLHRIFDCPDPKLNISKAIYEGRIILIDLGKLTEAQMIYATLIVSKIRQTIDRNLPLLKSQRVHYWLYADEFQTFQTSDFKDFLSRMGGLGLHLTLSNQYPHQIASDIWEAAFKNINNYYLFQLDPTDTAMFKPYFPEPHAPKDRSVERERLYRTWKGANDERENYWGMMGPTDDMSMAERHDEAGAARVIANMQRMAHQRDAIAQKVKELDEDIERDVANSTPDFVKELIHMPVGLCVYLAMRDKITRIIPVPPPRDEQNPTSNAQLINRVTQHQFSAEPFDRSCYTEPIHASSDQKDYDGGTRTRDKSHGKTKRNPKDHR